MLPPSHYLPLSEPTFYILLSLSSSEKHGYAILKDVEDLSGGQTRLSASTLYEAISRLLEQGLIERVESGHDNGSRRPRKVYRLTHLGRQVLGGETSRMQRLVEKAQLRLAREQS
jgi:DNA-binding PadR family transcriptional regulator